MLEAFSYVVRPSLDGAMDADARRFLLENGCPKTFDHVLALSLIHI